MTTELPRAIPFGIGCFALEFKAPPEVVTLREWSDAVKKALELLPTVDAVMVETLGEDQDQTRAFVRAQNPSAELKLAGIQEFFPEWSGVNVRFELGIPKRFHAKYIDYGDVGESFRVDISYGYECVVAYIACLNDDPSNPNFDGSRAVVLVRKYLSEALAKSDGPIELGTLGPSPFHAQFVLRPREDEEFGFAVKDLGRAGYDSFEITYPSDETPDSAYYDLRYAITDEATLYYDIVRRRNRRLENAALLASRTNVLVQASAKKGWRAAFGRVFGTARAGRELGLLAIQARLITQSDVSYGKSAIETLERETRIMGLMAEAISKEAYSLHDESIDNALAVVNFVEGARSKEFEVAVVASSTFLGALAGAIAALIAGGS